MDIDDEVERLPGNIFLLGSDWEPFFFGAQEIRAKLGVSYGVSDRMLRELCANGDVRSIIVGLIDGTGRPMHRIKPSEWRATPEMDMGDNDLTMNEEEWVEVSMDDLEYWLDRQKPEAEPKPKHKRDEAIAKRLKEGIVPGSSMPWKTWDDLIRKDIGAKATDVGCSDVRIEKITQGMMKHRR
jgi:hypothetical protein